MTVGGRGEMAYAAGLGPVGGDTVGVQIPPPALKAAPSAQGGTLTQSAHTRYTQRVGGNHALLLIEYLTDTKIPARPRLSRPCLPSRFS